MADIRPKALLVSPADIHGGAERCAYSLFEGLRARGIETWLAVGERHGQSPHVLLVPNDEHRSGWARLWRGIASRISNAEEPPAGVYYAARLAQAMGEPSRFIGRWRGHEDFAFPGTQNLLKVPPKRPNIVHLHNLHSARGYFDLRFLKELSARVPLVVSMHDFWLGTGHCAYPPGCERWKTGCGRCPDLNIYPSVLRDATAHNWRVKRDIYSKSRFYVATASLWLLRQVKQSILSPAIIEGRVIPTGVDRHVFCPADRGRVRSQLGISPNATVLMYAGANGIWRNPYKDFSTIHSAMGRLHGDAERPLLLLVVGEAAPEEKIGNVTVSYVPFQADPAAIANYYQAADVFLHAAKSDTFPNTVLEALSCGTPVVATAVGGIPEQINSLQMPWSKDLKIPGDSGICDCHDVDRATGVLVPPADPDALARAINLLHQQAQLRKQLSDNAARVAGNRFDIEGEVTSYVEWYRAILSKDSREDIESAYMPAERS
jgi:glycosyltransferase involved in cell wall biosynthesis